MTGLEFRLPTESEWQYAATSGGKSEDWAGTNDQAELGMYARYENNSDEKTHPVGQKKPNGLGLSDMTGNVSELIDNSVSVDLATKKGFVKGYRWDKVESAKIAIKKKDSEDTELFVEVGWDKKKGIPETMYSVKLIAYVADFAFDKQTKTIYSKSSNADNPAVQVEVYKEDSRVSTPWLFLGYPGMFPTMPDT